MKDPSLEARSSRRFWWFLVLLAAGIGLAGYYGPWVAHRAAGLIVIGLDLAEFVKFLPEVASGRIAFRREVFYLPLVAGSVTASLMASRRFLPTWLRWILAIGAAPLALAMLPPAWSPVVLLAPEFRLQVLAIVICLMLIPGIALTRYLPDWLILAVIAILATLAAVGPAWAFQRVRGSINHVYGQPPALGWGFWLNLMGFLAEAFLATAEILRPNRNIRRKRRV
jgi:hypothetical protein